MTIRRNVRRAHGRSGCVCIDGADPGSASGVDGASARHVA
jgi:hypothetical protein